jgi:hypothetical protein
VDGLCLVTSLWSVQVKIHCSSTVTASGTAGAGALIQQTTDDATGHGCGEKCDPAQNNSCQYAVITSGSTTCNVFPKSAGVIGSGGSDSVVFEQVEIDMCSSMGGAKV